MGNVACEGQNETGYKTLKKFLTTYQNYNTYKLDKNKPKSNKHHEEMIKMNENIINDHYKQFIMKKNEMEIINPNMYNLFFKDKIEECMEVKNISKDDESKFFYFLNLRTSIKEIKILNSQLYFPSFGARYFPKYNLDNSTITKISINESDIVFRDTVEDYNFIKFIVCLDLSYNNIPTIPIHFNRLCNIEYLYLKRNKLKNLDLNYNLGLKDLDLSENEFSKIPDFVFNLKNLVKLNMNSNELSELPITKDNKCLEYLYLVNNKFTKIPIEINYFRKLKHMALDCNKITEIAVNNLKDDLCLKITLTGNNITRAPCPDFFENNILTLPIQNEVLSNLKTPSNIKNESIDLKIDEVHNKSNSNFILTNNSAHVKNQSKSSLRLKNSKEKSEVEINKVEMVKINSEDDKIDQILEEEIKYKNCKY